MKDLFLIKGETITNIANSIRDCLGEETYGIDPAVIEEPYVLAQGSVQPVYYEFVDMPEDIYVGLNDWEYKPDVFVAYQFFIKQIFMSIQMKPILETNIFMNAMQRLMDSFTINGERLMVIYLGKVR